MKKKIFSFLLSLLTVSFLHAQTWNGIANSDWNTPANWTPNVVPLPGAAVLIPFVGITNWPVLAANTSITTFDMNAGSQMDFNGFILTVSSTIDIQGAALNNSNVITDIVININNAGGGGVNYFGSNIINDHITLNFNGTATTFEGITSGNTYNGNTSFNINGTGTFTSCRDQKCTYNGDLNVNRTVSGITILFNQGFNYITGNFSYTNNAGGASGYSYINNGNNASGTIGGTININTSGAGNPTFSMRKIRNLTSGGSISVQNSGLTVITSDTLLLASFDVNGFLSLGATDELSKCVITGNITFSDNAANTFPVYVGENIINGSTTLTSNSAATWFEGVVGGNTYNGNTIFDLNGTGPFTSCRDQKCTFNGNLTVNRTVSGITTLFNLGFNYITGNFSYTNNAGGDNLINSLNNESGTISGTVNISTSGASNPQFFLRKIRNLTTGGSISVQNSGRVFIDNDTLLLVSFDVNGFYSLAINDEFRKNVITGNVTFSDNASNTGSVYLGENTITGNASFISNSIINWYDSYQGSNIYNGHVEFTRTSGSGTFTLAFNDTTYVNQNLVLNSSAGFVTINSIEFGGSSNTSIEQLGIQPINIPRLIMNKTSGASLTLNDSVTVSTTATFTSGNIISDLNKHLIFSDNASYTGASVSSHVSGPVSKIGNDAFTFPVGTPTSVNTVFMTAPGSTTDKFSTQYYKINPSLAGYDTSQHAVSLQRISGCEYWEVRRLNGISNVTLTFSFAAPCSGNPAYISNPAFVRIARWTGTTWENLGNGGSTGTTTGTITTAAVVTNFSPFSFGSVDIAINPLPVTLIDFTASKDNGKTKLSWQTTDEINLSHFVIERSANGINYLPVATVTAKNIQGTHDYVTFDQSPVKAVNYYRLKIADLDNRFTYSSVRKVDFQKDLSVTISPNPASGEMTIQSDKKITSITLLDMNGRIIKQFSTSVNNRYDISNMSQGMYLLRVFAGESAEIMKLLVQ